MPGDERTDLRRIFACATSLVQSVGDQTEHDEDRAKKVCDLPKVLPAQFALACLRVCRAFRRAPGISPAALYSYGPHDGQKQDQREHGKHGGAFRMDAAGGYRTLAPQILHALR